MTEAEEQEIKNASDKLLMAGKAMIGKRRATRQECMGELQRRIVNRRKEEQLRSRTKDNPLGNRSWLPEEQEK